MESTINTSEIINPIDAKAYYLNLLGRSKLPEKISDFPEKLLIPCDFFSDVPQMFHDSLVDQKERGQTIYVKENRIVKSPIILGKEDCIEFSDNPYSSMTNSKKALIQFHTHPGGKPLHSFSDVRAYHLYPQVTFIFGAINEQGGSFLCQTQKTASLLRASLTPWSYILTHKMNTRHEHFPGLSKTEKFGFAFYSLGRGSNPMWGQQNQSDQNNIVLSLIRNPLEKIK